MSLMKLYMLRRYKSSRAILVRSLCEEGAYELAAEKLNDFSWMDKKRTYCYELPVEGMTGVILAGK